MFLPRKNRVPVIGRKFSPELIYLPIIPLSPVLITSSFFIVAYLLIFFALPQFKNIFFQVGLNDLSFDKNSSQLLQKKTCSRKKKSDQSHLISLFVWHNSRNLSNDRKWTISI